MKIYMKPHSPLGMDVAITNGGLYQLHSIGGGLQK